MNNIIYTMIFILFAIIFIILFIFLSKFIIPKINLIVPDFNSVIFSGRSDDPYIRSIVGDERINSDLRKLKIFIGKIISFSISVVLSIFLLSLILSNKVKEENGNNVISGNNDVSYGRLFSHFEKIEFGPLGDLFNGFVTPILTFGTFFGMFITIVMQHIQMRATLSELQMSRIEMADSTSALQAQVKNSEAQKFDNNFYSLLNNNLKIIDRLYETGLVNETVNKIKSNNLNYINIFSQDENKYINIFLSNYHLLKYIRRKELNGVLKDEDAKDYANILRSVIPEDIQIFILINCHGEKHVKYRNLLERYQFFEHLSFDDYELKSIGRAIASYSLEGFGDAVKLRNYIDGRKIFDDMNITRFINSFRDKVSSFHSRLNEEDKFSLAMKNEIHHSIDGLKDEFEDIILKLYKDFDIEIKKELKLDTRTKIFAEFVEGDIFNLQWSKRGFASRRKVIFDEYVEKIEKLL